MPPEQALQLTRLSVLQSCLVAFGYGRWSLSTGRSRQPAAEHLIRWAARRMNWEAIAAIGEAVGAAGVVASLVYLAAQIRQNSQSVRRAAARQTGERNAIALRGLADYSELFSGNFMGLDRVSELDPSQRTRFDMIFGMWMQALEQSFADVREGAVDAEYAVPYRYYLRQIFSCPGGQRWWSERKAWFSASFQAEVDRLIGGP